jgi:hypothetical protein
MATTTPNFGWSVPTSTDLVKDGATAIETLGDSIDASLVDLKGGTTGQVLAKNSNTDMDFIWSNDAAGMTNPMTTTGDTIYSSSGSTPARLGIGTAGQVLQVNSGATAPEWATPTSGAPALAQIASGSLTSGTELQLSSLTSYDTLIFRVAGLKWGTGASNIEMKVNNNTTGIYDYTVAAAYAQDPRASKDNFTAGTSLILSCQPFKRDANENYFFVVFENCKASGFTNVSFNGSGNDSGGFTIFSTGSGIFKSSAAVSTLEFKTSNSYTFSAGSYVLWGS